MRRLLPLPVADVPDDEPYPELADDGPWVALGMVSSLDGAATDAEGRSGGLGGDGDRAAFRALRAACDVILVGAGTARTERYGPAHLSPAQQARRRDRGQAAQPVVAVVTRSLDLTGAEALWGDDRAPLVVTTVNAPEDEVERLVERGSTVIRAGDTDVDLAVAVSELAGRGLVRVLAEGGPRLAGDLLAADLVDRLFVTLAPTLVGGDAPRIATGAAFSRPVTLDGVRVHDDELLLAYRVVR